MVPSIWLKGIINPIPKSSGKDPLVSLNYRGISLLSCMAKMYTSLLNNRLQNYCDDFELLADEQNGFRRSRSCLDHIFTLTSVIRNRIVEKQPTFCAFIDFEKAFDWIDRDLLMLTLLKYNINEKIYKSIEALYKNTLCCVKLNAMFSGWFLSNSGVRQGDSLSPTLFALLINSLVGDISELNLGIEVNENLKLSIMLYADDIVLLAENEQDLQRMIDCLLQWCHKWRLKVNIDKSNVVHFRHRRGPCTKVIFKYSEAVLHNVSKYKYLGIYLDCFLKYEEAAKILGESAGRALCGTIGKYKSFKNVTFRTFSKLYHSAVVPVSDYGAAIWGYKHFPGSNNVHNRAMRYFLGVHKFAPNAALQGDIGWLPPIYRRHLDMLRFWNRVISMNPNRLTKRVFENDYLLGKANWCSEVKEILTEVNLAHIFVNRTKCDINILTEKPKEKLNREWLEAVASKPKLRVYRQFKTDLTSEYYVNCFMSRYKRSLLAQFRMGILPLNVELGRFVSIPLEKRICQICNTNEIEDEIHFLCSCEMYKHLRHELYAHITKDLPDFTNFNNLDKFLNIMRNDNYCKYVVEFVCKAWDLRKTKLYV